MPKELPRMDSEKYSVSSMLFCGPQRLNLSLTRNQSNDNRIIWSHGPRVARLVQFNSYCDLHVIVTVVAAPLQYLTSMYPSYCPFRSSVASSQFCPGKVPQRGGDKGGGYDFDCTRIRPLVLAKGCDSWDLHASLLVVPLSLLSHFSLLLSFSLSRRRIALYTPDLTSFYTTKSSYREHILTCKMAKQAKFGIGAGMEQFRHIGEVVGSLKALMVLQDEIEINQRQCRLIVDMFSLAMETIAEEIRQNLKLEERNTKWKPLEHPLRELCRVLKEGELYIRKCLDSKEWLGKAMSLSNNRDCVEFHIHNLLCYFPAVMEAIESAGEVSGLDPDEKEKKKTMLARKYDVEWNDPKLFQWRFGKQYLVPGEICKQLENAWREDRWRVMEAIKEKSQKKIVSKSQHHLADLLLKKMLNGSEIGPITLLIGSKDYQVRRRLGRGREFKEIQWLGQSFALRQLQGERQMHEANVFSLLLLSHPNILQLLCAFYDEEKQEFSLVMELMTKNLWTYMKENCGPRRQILFSVPVVVDLMLQIARGMEYLHSKNIYHGHLNPGNILLKARNSQEGYFQAKISGFGLACLNDINNGGGNEEHNPLTWYAPEVLTQLERSGNASSCGSEKGDAYSFGMICFELLTGKVPFEDNHLQGDRTKENIKAGERPLFPYSTPKYLVTLIKKCWQTEAAQRPSFSSICRILRYTKKFLAMNTELEPNAPPVDFCDLETTFLKCLSTDGASSVSQIPYQMFAYKVTEKEKMNQNSAKDKFCEPCTCRIDQSSASEDDNASVVEDPLPLLIDPPSLSADTQSLYSQVPPLFRKTARINEQTQVKTKKDQGTSKFQVITSLPSSLSNRVLRTTKPSLAPSSLSPGRNRPPLVSESDSRNSKWNQSPSVPIPSSSVRRKKYEGFLSDSKATLMLKKKVQSSLTLTNVTCSSKMKKSQLTNPCPSPGGLRRANTDTNLKGLTKSCTSKRPGTNGLTTDNNGLKMTKGRFLSDTESSFVKKRASLSPFGYSLLSPYTRTTCGHVSD
ncbi:hypothetical protein VNO78_07684 [Psophocarpus tetragonolobus]|uniref:Protein kinase domain-containing protein n=1 Tax=Psophocarpus tetragonolobus TaxID=3891 RepID=A0AAN9T3N8_PSOTE